MPTVAELEAERDRLDMRINLMKKLEELGAGEVVNVHVFKAVGGPPTSFLFKEPGPVEELKTVIRDLLKDEAE